MCKAAKFILLILFSLFIVHPLYAASPNAIKPDEVVQKLKSVQDKLGPWEAASSKREKFLFEKNYPEALKAGKEALKIAENTFGAENQTVAASLYGLGMVYKAQGNLTEAEACFSRSVDLYIKTVGANKNMLSAPLEELIKIYELQNRPNQVQALRARLKALNYQEK